LRDCGYNQGLCRLLSTDPANGILGDEEDLNRRRKVFGTHSIAMPRITAFSTILYSQFEDANVIMLTQAAAAYLCTSLFSTDASHNGAIESLTIFSGLMFACTLAAICDYIKESQHLKLKDEINNQ